MALKPRPSSDRDYWEGAADGMAEIAEQVTKQIRDGIAEAQAEHEPGAPDIIKRSAMIEYLQGLARKLDEVAATTRQIIEGHHEEE